MKNKIDFEKISELIGKLKTGNQTIAIMESCTGGGLANSITNISGASDVFEFGAVTYSNKAKIALGGEKMKKAIDSYSVYSKEVAETMAEAIVKFTSTTYGIGVTGQLGLNNSEVYFSIYDSTKKTYDSVHLSLEELERQENKAIIINEIIERLFIVS